MCEMYCTVLLWVHHNSFTKYLIQNYNYRSTNLTVCCVLFSTVHAYHLLIIYSFIYSCTYKITSDICWKHTSSWGIWNQSLSFLLGFIHGYHKQVRYVFFNIAKTSCITYIIWIKLPSMQNQPYGTF